VQVPISIRLKPVAVSYTVSEIVSLKEWRDLETGAGVVQGHTNTKHRAASLRQQSYLLIALVELMLSSN